MEQEAYPSQVLNAVAGGQLFQEVRETLACEEQVDCPLTHRFTKGLYTREIFMAANTLVISKIHKTQHPFVILKGSVSVAMKDGGEPVLLKAGHIGITEPGTERLLFVHEDTVWVTFHPNPTDETSLQVLEGLIIQEPLTITEQ